MVEISNRMRDEAVKYLQALADISSSDDRIQVMNLCRLARRLAKQLSKREKR